MIKQTIWFPTRTDANPAVHAQKMARGWKFWFYKVEEYISCSKTKGAFGFAYADCWFSHEATLILK